MPPLRILPILAVSLLIAANAAAQEVLTWEAALKETKKNHPDLIAGREDIKQAEAEIGVAVADFMPSIDFSVNGESFGNESGASDGYSHGISASQEINYDIFNEYQRAKQQLKTAKYFYMVQSSNILLRLRRAFFILMREQELVRVAEEIVGRRQANADLVNGRRADEGASLTAQANLSQAQADLSDAQRRRELAQRRLLREMGRSAFSDVQAAGTFDVIDPQRTAPDFAGISETTPFLQAISSITQEEKIDVRGAKGAYLPEIFIDAGHRRSAGSWPPREGDESWSVGFSLDFEIFDGGSRWAELKREKSDVREAKQNERSTRDEITVVLNERWAIYQDALDNVPVQQKFLQSTEARARLGADAYSNGKVDFDDWIIIEDNFADRKRTFVNAQAEALLTEADWQAAKGETLEDI